MPEAVIRYVPGSKKDTPEESQKTQGVLFFNIGKNCLLRAFVAIYTLRKYYKGNVSILLSKTDEFSEFFIENIKPFDVKHYWYEPVVECKRNTGYTIKPHVLSQSPLDITLYSDTDVIFKADPTELFPIVEEHKLVLTPYRDWVTTGKGMSRRIKKLGDILPAEQIEKSLAYGTAINTGVMGYTKEGTEEFFKDWIETTLKGQGRFIIDELACQCICYKYPHALIGKEWNFSCREPDCSPGKVIHFHGRKHARPERYEHSALWLEEFYNLRDSGQLNKKAMRRLVKWDRYVRKYEQNKPKS